MRTLRRAWKVAECPDRICRTLVKLQKCSFEFRPKRKAANEVASRDFFMIATPGNVLECGTLGVFKRRIFEALLSRQPSRGEWKSLSLSEIPAIKCITRVLFRPLEFYMKSDSRGVKEWYLRCSFRCLVLYKAETLTLMKSVRGRSPRKG